MKRWLIFVFALIFGLSFVSAGALKILIGNASPSPATLMIIKYVFTGIVFVIIFWVLHTMRLPENKILQIIFSLGVAFLATAFISPSEIWSIFQTYIAVVAAVVVAIVLVGIYLLYRTIKGPSRIDPNS